MSITLNRPNARRVQLVFFYDYRTNVELYPKWQVFLKIVQLSVLILLRNRLRPRVIRRDDNVPCRCHEESLAVFFLIC
jgi:hypothetical protein